MAYFKLGTNNLTPTETRDIIAAKIEGRLPISDTFRLAVIPSAMAPSYVLEDCLYPEIPIGDQAIGRNNDTPEARYWYWISNQRIGCKYRY